MSKMTVSLDLGSVYHIKSETVNYRYKSGKMFGMSWYSFAMF